MNLGRKLAIGCLASLLLLVGEAIAEKAAPKQAADYHFMSTEELMSLLRDPRTKPDEEAGAFRALAFSGDPSGLEMIGRVLRETPNHPRAVSLLRLIGHIGEARGVPIAALQLHSPEAKVAEAARLVIQELLGSKHASKFLEIHEKLEAHVGSVCASVDFCRKLQATEFPKGEQWIPSGNHEVAAPMSRLIARSCPETESRPVPGLPETPERYGALALQALAKPGMGNRADELMMVLENMEQDAVPILGAAIKVTRDKTFRHIWVELLSRSPWKQHEATRGPRPAEPDWVLERVEGLANAFADSDSGIRRSAIAGAANLIESQGDGSMMSTGYRRFRYKKALRRFVEPVAKLLKDEDSIRASAIEALRAMRIPEATAALASAGAAATSVRTR